MRCIKRRASCAYRRPMHRQTGLSLVELMVAMVISLLIMVAILQLYLDITRTNDEMVKTNAQIENGRFAIQLLEQSLTHAGFWGGYIPQFDDLTSDDIPGDTPSAVPPPCDSRADWPSDAVALKQYKDNLIGIPVQAYNDVPVGCSSLVSSRQAGTDVLVVRHANTCVTGSAGCEAEDPDKLYFQASFCDDDVSTYALDNVAASFDLHTRVIPTGLSSCADPSSTLFADKRKFISSFFFIRDYAVTAGDGIPTLMRSQFDLNSGSLLHQPAQPLIEGVEAFRIELGVDNLSKTGAAVNYAEAVNWANSSNKTTPTNRGDGVPDGAFVHCPATGCSVEQLRDVVAVKLYVLVRSQVATPGYVDQKSYSLGGATVGPFSDGFKRHVFSSTVRLNNVSGRRETP